MLNENNINERIKVLDNDIIKANQQLVSLDKQKIEVVGLLNALNGAKQQCMNFLKDISDEDQEGQEEGSSSSEGDDS